MNKVCVRIVECIAAGLLFFFVLTLPVWAEQSVQDGEQYAPGEVIVMFSDGAVADGSSSISKSRSLQQVGSGYGQALQASGAEEEAAEDAASEVEILKEILGGEFTIEDSLVFADEEAESSANAGDNSPSSVEEGDLSIALVSSEAYDTEEMIEKLSKSDAIASVEPNYYVHPVDFAEYSLDDTYNQYLYQLNSPKAVNQGGKSVSDRGTDPDEALSVNASGAWKQLTGDEEEVVVAVLDTGVLDTHEDLADRMWTNPGDIGLLGEHGYNFYENTEDSAHDDIGHGTHCAGVIAAQADNGTGTAGIAGKADVKIMALKFMGKEEVSTLYTALGAFSYVLKAKQAGVNVAATSNSWSSDCQVSIVYDSVIDRLGEAGILTFISAGNEASDVDRVSTVPVTSESDYTVVVGAADITGKAGPFSNFGKSCVDLYAPGVNVLSTVGYDSYLPSIYTAEELAETTEYYGEFSEDTVITENTVTPDTGDRAGDTVKPFGASVFYKQAAYQNLDPAEPEKATCEISIDDSDRYFSADHPKRLKLTIRDAQPDEEYFFYFPYEKNAGTKGDADT